LDFAPLINVGVVERRHFRLPTLVVSAGKEISEILRPNYEILVLRACFQVSNTVLSAFFGLEFDFNLAGLSSRVENIHVSHDGRNLACIDEHIH